MRRLCVMLLAVCSLPISARAQDDVFAAKVEEARKRGVDFLISEQREDGSWEYEKHEVGITALCTLALVENGISPSDEVIKKGVDYVRDRTRELTSTYDMALAIVLLSKIGSRKDKDKIKGLAAGLLAGQLTSGGWSYSCPKGSKAMLSNPRAWPKAKASPGDNSCTQFAVLGLWVASRDDVEIERAMSGVARRFVYFQNEDGGWGYKVAAKKAATDDGDAAAPAEDAPAPEGGGEADAAAKSKNSMTFAGLFCLTVARATKIRAEQEDRRTRRSSEAEVEDRVETPEDFVDEGSEAKTLLEDPIFERGLDRAGEFAKGIGGGASMYFMWSAERLGVMLGLEKIGDVEWFERAASTMIARQATDGSWPGGHGNYSDTAFAVLVLRKANLGSDITRLLEGEPAQPFGIVETEERFDTLQEAIAKAQAGATIRIEGDGPFQLPHLVVDKDLVLQAGFGYEPVFTYDVGVDRFGIRARPEKDVNVRNMLRTTSGTLVLEGLKLEMDPAFSTQKDLDWHAVVADGGNLRMLNCTVTESNKRGATAVELRQPGTHVIRNCVLSATVAALYVNGAGTQDITIDNSLLFSDVAIDLRQDVKFKGESKVVFDIRDTTIQAREAMRLLTLATCPVEVTFENNVVQADGLSPSLLVKPGDKSARTWTGNGNLYDVDKWVGFRGRTEASVTNLASWKRFWGNDEEESSDRLAAFTVRRPLASFSHRMRPEDWELTDERLEHGIYPLTVGTGRHFSRFRSTFQYNSWNSGETPAVASAN